MKLSFSSKEKVTIAAAALILILYVVIAQFYFLSPLKADLTSKQQTLKSDQKLLSDLRTKANSNNVTVVQDTTEMQRELPVEPLQDQFILNLQQAENASDSQIKSMSFTEGAATAAGTQNGGSNNSSGGQTTGSSSAQTSNNSSSSSQSNSNSNNSNSSQNNSNSSNSNSSAQQQASQSTTSTTASSSNQQSASSSVSGLNKLTVQLSVQSPNYQDFETFIQTLEGLKRIVVVEAINYTGGTEITSADQAINPLTYTLTVSAYYMPGLTDLQTQLPKDDYPAPANKDNPLATFPDLTANP